LSIVNQPTTLRDLIATNMRRLRNGTNVQPEDVAKAATHFGLEWTAAWVSGVERGQKAITAEQMIALPLVLTTALSHRVSLADLLLGEGSLHLGKSEPGTTVSTYYLREIMTASPFRRSFLDFDLPDPEVSEPEEPSPALAAAEKMREIVRANLGEVDVRALKRAEDGMTDQERKLAKKLGIPEIVVIAAAASLWGRSMSEERDALMEGLPSHSKAAISRRLSTAIVERLEQAEADARVAEAEAVLRKMADSNSVTAAYPIVATSRPRPRQPIDWDAEYGPLFDEDPVAETARDAYDEADDAADADEHESVVPAAAA
jgi:hypothetical protein